MGRLARCMTGPGKDVPKAVASPLHNGDGGSSPHRAIWAYGYALVPPVARSRMGPMEVLIKSGHATAVLASRTWEGRLINGDEITHILVVSDSPDQNLEVNREMEAELKRLEAPFSITAPITIDGRSRSLRGRAREL